MAAGLFPDAGGIPALDAQDQGLPGPIIQANPQEVLNALLLAVQRAAESGSGSDHMQDMNDGSKAALAYAQAFAILNPQLDPSGLPLDHHIQMEITKGQNSLAIAQQQGADAHKLEVTRGQNALAQAKEAARAPTPAKSVQVRRDSTGRAQSYDVSG
jgi:hypothetical protein